MWKGVKETIAVVSYSICVLIQEGVVAMHRNKARGTFFQIIHIMKKSTKAVTHSHARWKKHLNQLDVGLHLDPSAAALLDQFQHGAAHQALQHQ